MKSQALILFILLMIASNCNNTSREDNLSESLTGSTFNIKNDLLLVHYDCKTDVDDLHSIAAFATLLFNPAFADINYHAVAGTYGTQDGPYVPPNTLFQLAFGGNWTDADHDFEAAVLKVKSKALKTLSEAGDIWIADAGQSDFSAGLIKSVKLDLPGTNITGRIHIVQHSDWNEEVTSPEALQYVKQNSDYHKIPDGNVIGNGSPGFRTPASLNWEEKITHPELAEIWHLAIDLGNTYNGKEGRYLNEAIASGGVDFSDLSEVCWILGIGDIENAEDFFTKYAEEGLIKDH